jgi:hypothetical protein
VWEKLNNGIKKREGEKQRNKQAKNKENIRR